MIHALKRAVALGGLFTLAACGGGGGTAQVRPTPAPPAAAPSTFPLASSEPFQTIVSRRFFTGSGNNLSGESGVSGRGPAFTISYDAANGTYSIDNEGRTATFGAGDRTTSGNYDVYAKQANGISDELKLFGNIRQGGPQAGAPVQLTYLSFGTWTRTTESTGEVRKYHFLLGYPTLSTSMPTTGTATYQTMVAGSMMEGGVGFPNTYNDVNGTASFVANFGAGTVNTDLSLTRAGNGQSLGSYTGTGTIYGSNQFQGTFTTGSQFVTHAAFMGGFFGPSATEMGYAFSITKVNPDPYAGATIAPQYTHINGVVIGKKQ